ncbi:MAG: serine/threonine protein kinase, partial [Gemmatimonadota bacterium]|nr:serine/threonine protein kinase [Gemmatimonadota bacterium]
TLPLDSAFCLKCGHQLVGQGLAPAEDSLAVALERAVGSQYKIDRLLGRGGMGAVYLAREVALDRLVAIKVLPPETGDSENIERFRREARTAGRLTHPNIVPLYTFGEGEGILYFVMGYVRGEPLSDRLRRKGALPHEEVQRIVGEIASALKYAHEQGVVHRDIKPDNILMEDDTGRPMLTDFGVARSLTSGTTLTEVGAAIGTPHYMSPEQAAGESHLDGRSDLYSLGVVAYEMLAGRKPFDGKTVREILVQQMTGQPQPLQTMAAEAPAPLVHLVEQCLVKDPELRVQNAEVLTTWLGQSNGELEEIPEEMEAAFYELRIWAGTVVVSAGAALLLPLAGMFVEAAAAVGIGALGVAGIYEKGRQHKKSKGAKWWETVSRWAFKEPRWWSTWWPKKWRHKDDLWDRLPKPFKTHQRALAICVAGMLLTTDLMFFQELFGWEGVSFYFLMTPLVLASWAVPVVSGTRFWRWLRKNNISAKHRRLFLLDGTPGFGSRFWKKPEIQRILLPAETSGSQAFGRPAEPKGYLRSLKESADQLTGPEADLARAAADAAQEVVGAIEELDVQIEAVARSADPSEIERLEQKLEAIGLEGDVGGKAQHKMKELIEQQLVLAQGLSDQLGVMTKRRGHFLDLLNTLWLQVANLRAHRVDGDVDSGEISAKIRAVSLDIRQYLEAADEIDNM